MLTQGGGSGWVFPPSFSPLLELGVYPVLVGIPGSRCGTRCWGSAGKHEGAARESGCGCEFGLTRVPDLHCGTLWGLPKNTTWAPGHRREGEASSREVSSTPYNIFISAFTSQLFETHPGQSRAGAGHEEKQPRPQPRQEGLFPQGQQPLTRPQSVPALHRSREVAGQARPALFVTPATPVATGT